MKRKKEDGVYEIAMGQNGSRFAKLGSNEAKAITDAAREFMRENEKKLERIAKETPGDNVYHKKLTMKIIENIVVNSVFYEIGDTLWKNGYDVNWD